MSTEERILEKARDLFFRYGLRNVTMDRIAQELGISKKTLYASYDKKKTIVKKITDEFIQCQEQEMTQLEQDSSNAIEELIGIMHNINRIFESMDFHIVYDMQRYFPESWNLFEIHKNEFIHKSLINNLENGQKQGLYREDIHVDIIAKLRLEQIQITMDPTKFPPEKYDVKEIHKQSLIQYMHGISTLKGHQLINTYLNRHEEV